jgi:hypothetical protein
MRRQSGQHMKMPVADIGGSRDFTMAGLTAKGRSGR